MDGQCGGMAENGGEYFLIFPIDRCNAPMVKYAVSNLKGQNKRSKAMPRQHDQEKHQISVKFLHPIWRQIEKAAEERKMKPGEFVRWVVTREVESVELTEEDAQLVLERIKQAKSKGKGKMV